MAVESKKSDLTEDVAVPSGRSWFKIRERKGHALSYSAAVFATVIVIFALGILVGLGISDLFLSSAVGAAR